MYGDEVKLAPAAIFSVAFAIRISLVIIRQDYLHPAPDEPVKVARSLHETGVFGNPFLIPTGETAHVAPFQPYLISLSYAVFGEGPPGELARHIVGCAASSMIYAILPYAAVAFGLPAAAGLIAGGAGALLPLKYHTEVSGSWEAPWAALAMILLMIYTARRLRLGTIQPGRALLDGALWGFGVLISPALLPILAGVIVVEAIRFFGSDRHRYISFLALRMAVMVAVLTPWTVRNYRAFGVFCPVRCNFGFELYTGNNPRAHPLQLDYFESEAPPHPAVSMAECLRLIALGPARYDREKRHLALSWIEERPARFLYFTAAHMVLFWFSWSPNMIINLANWTLAALGIAGMVRLIRAQHPAVPLLLSIWITFPPVYYITESTTKYRYPIDWTFLLLAGYLVVTTFPQLSANSSRDRDGSGRF